MSRKKRFLTGLLLLLLAPVLVVALFAAYAYWDNSRPQTGALQAWVKPSAVFPWEESSYFILFNQDKGRAEPAPQIPIDVAFVVDVSSSMTEFLPDMATAATEVLKELAVTRPGQISFALIRFDTAAEINTNWTGDTEKLYAGLTNPYSVGSSGTDPLVAFDNLDELLGQARSQSKKAVVFFTDGEFSLTTAYEVTEKAKRLRDGGVDIYSVGVPVKGSTGIIYQMTDDPRRVFNPTNVKDIAANFRLLAEGIVPGFGEGGQFSNRVDGRHFSVPLEETNWSADSSGALNLTVGKIPETPITYSHPLVPHSAGLWSVGTEPVNLVFANKDGQLQRITATHRPLIFVITWPVLLLMMLPALGWILSHIPSRSRRDVLDDGRVLPPVFRPTPPTRLPALPRREDQSQPLIPTLFIGLGGAGKRALHSISSDLKQARLESERQPYRFLWIDLDTKQAEREMPFYDWEAFPIEGLIAPPEIRQAQQYLPEPGNTPEHLSWFDTRAYQNAARNELNLSEGTKGDRPLARLALFEWVSKKNSLFPKLADECKELAALYSEDGTRQIIILASNDGGVGSGWFLDMGRLLRRVTRKQQEEGLEFVPEIIGVLCEHREASKPQNQRALEMEIESAVLAGAFPTPVVYARGEPLLEQVDTESPYNWIFKTSDSDADSVAAQCGELCAALVERYPRSSLVGQITVLEQGHPIVTIAHSVHVLPAVMYEQIRYEFFLRMVGPDILLDIEPNVEGGFSPKYVSEETATNHLQNWARNEPPGTPWQLLLAAATNPAVVPVLLKSLQMADAPLKEWLSSTFSESVTARLQGHKDIDNLGWHREWMSGDAVATLRLLADRIARVIRPQARGSEDAAQLTALLDWVAAVADSAASGLEKWVRDFCVICEGVSNRRSDSSLIQSHLQKLNRRTYIDQSGWRDQVEGWVKTSLETWLGTPDTISSIRERFYFSVLVEGAQANVYVRSFIEGAQDFRSAEQVESAIARYTQALSHLVPAVTIEGSIADLSEERQRMLARKLVDTQTAPRRVLVTAPGLNGWHSRELKTLNGFVKLIPQPANHGIRYDQLSDDHSAVRRMEIIEDGNYKRPLIGTKLPFVEAAEQAAEIIRLRAEKKYGISIMPFPPRLRIALSHAESFRSFARAYKAGSIGLRRDRSGAQQWMFLDRGEFLTFGSDRTLATAAANYVWYVNTPPKAFRASEERGSFAKLEQWLKSRHSLDDDTLVQLAIDVYEN